MSQELLDIIALGEQINRKYSCEFSYQDYSGFCTITLDDDGVPFIKIIMHRVGARGFHYFYEKNAPSGELAEVAFNREELRDGGGEITSEKYQLYAVLRKIIINQISLGEAAITSKKIRGLDSTAPKNLNVPRVVDAEVVDQVKENRRLLWQQMTGK